MKKIEIIWRELLFQAIEKKNHQFTQKELAKKFGFSTSTIFQALKAPRKMGAVRVTGRFFILEDPKKLLYHWASVRNLQKEIIFKGRVNLPILEIEGLMPPRVVFACFSAARHILGEPPADYDQVWVYVANLKSQISNLKSLKERFEFTKETPNLFILRGDEFLDSYGGRTTLAQTFVDLWNLSSWQAKDFTQELEEKIDELLP
ncbi:MAG: hypothetical protein ACOZBZ_04215 [Patescibacteria group bacterium]